MPLTLERREVGVKSGRLRALGSQVSGKPVSALREQELLLLLHGLTVAANAGFRAPTEVSGRPWQGCAHAG